MTRIVAGVAGGRRLQVPPRGTRPTSDRVREAVFGTLQSRVDLDGARVLDLYAGSGALGLEALSRGAAHARFVESDRRAAAILQRNVDALGLPGAEVTVGAAETVLRSGPQQAYDLVLADPPYSQLGPELADVLDALAVNRWLSPGALLVIERSARHSSLTWPEWVAAVTERKYGDTRVYYGQTS
ncbi:MAG: 16S rRNA (guanine(966)-N(2))-methyltransferase RsmD [Pseudonocardiaceae bacterium]|nr:16S rRNA (guanine(966)-N(2))-methyltransferase RsmD [Pseudonocardiaceae bacterium]